jgi:phosphonate metabolism-associated iron-containing alcohol dehydrogenase
MMPYQPFSPVDIRFETLQSFQEQLSLLSDKRVMVLADEGTFGRIKTACEGFDRFINDKKNRLVCDIRPNPSVDEVCRQLNMLRNEERYDCIMAIGGGSCIDLAKAISALRGMADTRDLEYEEIVEAIEKKSFFQEHGPAEIIAVPTTAGTGSEVTKWATVWDFRNKKKLSVEHNGCFPKVAIMIPELTESMPLRVTLSTGLDALSHAMEAFWAKKRNPLSQALALDSIGRIKRFLPVVLKNPNDSDARKEMCLSSLLAGLAFSITKTTSCHSISYPLTMNYGVEHGFAAAMTLSLLMAVNEEAVPEVREITGLFNDAGGFDKWMADVTQGIQELKLSSFGVREEMIHDIIQGAFTLGRMDNNPVPLQRESVKTILKSIL